VASDPVNIDGASPRGDASLAGLAQQAARGDGDAFRALYHRLSRVVHGILLARVGVMDADDLTQEVFLSAHRQLGQLRDPAALPSWLCTAARNLATDHLRRRQRRPAVETLQDVHPAPPQDGADNGELAGRVLDLIRGLPAAYAETLTLRLVEGLSGPEIAERTGLTPGSVRVNLCRGMAMLRSLLPKEEWS
jgi:RNA polymerase sigma-70 factor (ECF subfamily)